MKKEISGPALGIVCAVVVVILGTFAYLKFGRSESGFDITKVKARPPAGFKIPERPKQGSDGTASPNPSNPR